VSYQPLFLTPYLCASPITYYSLPINNIASKHGILDLFDKTGIGQLYTKNGTLIRELRIIVGGTYQLAPIVAQPPKLIRLNTDSH